MALLAEHMVDYHVLDKEGVRYEHGSLHVDTSGFRKVNVPYRPNELMAEDWSRVFIHGIDIGVHAHRPFPVHPWRERGVSRAGYPGCAEGKGEPQRSNKQCRGSDKRQLRITQQASERTKIIMPQLPSHLARAAKEFSQVRRQHFFYWEAYESILQKLDDYDRDTEAEITDFAEPERLSLAYESALEAKLRGSLNRMSLEYSAGASMEEVKDFYPVAIDAFEEWCGSFVKWVYHRFPERRLQFEEIGSLPCPVEEDDPDSYRELLRLISLGVLLGEHDQLRRIAKLIVNIRGADTIIEELLLPFVPDPIEINNLYHLELYQDLVGAAWQDGEESIKCMNNFLGRWYKFFEGAFWHDAHLRFGQLRDDPDWANYYGYWAWEAGAIAYLYELDDSAYRDHILYPKDLVDWARRQGPVPKHYTPPAHELPTALSARPGEPCPRAGVWFAPHLRMKEVTMQLGEPMPSEQVGPTGGAIWYFKG